MSDFDQEIAVYQAIQKQHQIHQTHENMDLHEDTDSLNDTEVIECLFTPYTDEPIAPEVYAATEYDNENPDLISCKDSC